MREIFAMFSHFQKDLFDLLEIGTQQNGNFKLLFPRTNRVKLLSQQELIPKLYMVIIMAPFVFLRKSIASQLSNKLCFSVKMNCK